MLTTPPKDLRKCGNFFYKSDAYWVGSGLREAERLRDYYHLNEASNILEIGCGAGRRR